MTEYYKNFSLENLPYINLEGLVCWEEFRDVPDYEGLYQISDLGRVKILKYRRPDLKRIMKLTAHNTGYCVVSLCKNTTHKVYNVHQLISITFLNHTPTDNRVENLEIVTTRENSNRKYIPSSSKYTGVSWSTTKNKWSSTISINGKSRHLGYFDSEEEA